MSERESPWLFEHTRRAATQGRAVLLGVVGTCLGLGVFFAFLIPSLWHENRANIVAIYLMLSAVGAAGIAFGIVNLRCSGTFVCRISRDVLECHVPVSGCGESFSIAISDIAAVEQEIPFGEGGARPATGTLSIRAETATG